MIPEGPLLWFLNRGTGLVLLLVLTLSLVLGILATGGRAGGPVPGFVLQRVHRTTSLLATALLGVHVLTSVVDDFVDIEWWQAFVPWPSAYQPLWLGLGALALDLILAVVLTSLLRARLGHRAWRGVHLTVYVAWAFGFLHGIGIGTDSAETWARWCYAGAAGLVTAAVVARIGSAVRDRFPLKTGAAL